MNERNGSENTCYQGYVFPFILVSEAKDIGL